MCTISIAPSDLRAVALGLRDIYRADRVASYTLMDAADQLIAVAARDEQNAASKFEDDKFFNDLNAMLNKHDVAANRIPVARGW